MIIVQLCNGFVRDTFDWDKLEMKTLNMYIFFCAKCWMVEPCFTVCTRQNRNGQLHNGHNSANLCQLELVLECSSRNESNSHACILPGAALLLPYTRDYLVCVLCVAGPPESVITLLHCYLVQKLLSWCPISLCRDGNLSVGLCSIGLLFILDDFNIVLDWNRQRFCEVLERY